MIMGSEENQCMNSGNGTAGVTETLQTNSDDNDQLIDGDDGMAMIVSGRHNDDDDDNNDG